MSKRKNGKEDEERGSVSGKEEGREGEDATGLEAILDDLRRAQSVFLQKGQEILHRGLVLGHLGQGAEDGGKVGARVLQERETQKNKNTHKNTTDRV